MYYLLLGCTSPIRSYFQCSTKLLKPKSIHHIHLARTMDVSDVNEELDYDEHDELSNATEVDEIEIIKTRT